MKTLFAFIAISFSMNATVAYAGFFTVPTFLSEGFPKMSGCSYGFSGSKKIIGMYDELMLRAIQDSNGDGHFVSLSKFDEKIISRDTFYQIQDHLIRKKSFIPAAVSTKVLVDLIAVAGSQAAYDVDTGQVADFIIKFVPAPVRTEVGFVNAYKPTNDAVKSLTQTIKSNISADGKNPWGYELSQAIVLGGPKTQVNNAWTNGKVDPKTEKIIQEYYRMTAEFSRAENESTQMGFLFGSKTDVKEEIVETILNSYHRIDIQNYDLAAAVAEAYHLFGAVAHFRVSGLIDQATMVEILTAVQKRSIEVFSVYKSELEGVKAAWEAEYSAGRSTRTQSRYNTTKMQLTLLNDFFWINGGSIGLPKIVYY